MKLLKDLSKTFKNKKLLSLICIIAIFSTIYSDKFLGYENVYAKEYRNGYLLTPIIQDDTGIDIKTDFLFESSSKEVKIEDLKNNLVITPNVNFDITKNNKGFLIELKEELKVNSIYTFTYDNVTWTFQTTSPFKILGVLPSNESTNVPVNTGIEIYFSHEGAKVEDYFEIEPKVEGSFEEHGNVVVFKPNELKSKTIYTITLKKGLPLKNSTKVLEEDYKFSFETAGEENISKPKGYFNFNKLINEVSTSEIPKLLINYSIYDEVKDNNIHTKVYSYKSMEDFSNALSEYNKIPSWTRYNLKSNKIETKGLEEVLSFDFQIVEKNHELLLELPSKLPEGYYVVSSTWNDINFQTFLQVTDLSFYYIEGVNKSLIWVNDLSNNTSVEGAKIIEKTSNNTYTTNENGIAEMSVDNSNDNNIYHIISNDKSIVFLSNEYWGYKNHHKDNYWKILATDRNLYLPNDDVKFWGFIKNRYTNEEIKEVTVEITNPSWWWRISNIIPIQTQEMPFIKTTIPVNKGFYEGSISLPNLEPDYYELRVKYNDEIIYTRYIEVDNYVKPSYKIEISKDKEAVFLNDKVNFTVKTSFFEGTPVSNLDVNYNIVGIDYINDKGTTNQNGEFKVSYTPHYRDNMQGEIKSYFGVFATLPESGEIYENDYVRVFINNINVDIKTSIEEEVGTIEAKVNKIVLDRLNNKTAKDDNDFLGSSVPNHKLYGTVYKNEWVKTEVGEYYDFINKVMRKKYEYNLETTKIKDIVLTTNSKGIATKEVNLPKEENVFYTLKINTKDLNGYSMNFHKYFSRYYDPYFVEDYTLELNDNKSYEIGEKFKVQFKDNGTSINDKGKFLYITSQNGIREYEITDSSTYERAFLKEDIPNITINGVFFNGKTYVATGEVAVRFNFETNKINLKAETDKESYKPGETVNVSLEATIYSEKDNKEIPVGDAFVNISIVDEALFKLKEQEVDVLNELYSWVPSGIIKKYASHYDYSNNNISIMDGKGMAEKRVAVTMDTAIKSEESNQSTYVRTNFKDTAYFKSLYLDQNGKGNVSFVLPDNVTSWRMTFAGISEKLEAGTNTEQLIVTLPFFINSSFNSIYLEGDKPSIVLSSYGSSLKENEEIKYEIYCEEVNYKKIVEGKAFEQVEIPLWDVKEGDYNIIIKATSKSGLSDAIEKEINVVPTHHMIEVADEYDLVKDINITTTNQGMTKLIILDKGKGKFMPKLYELSYSFGYRVDQKYISMLARQLLEEKYGIEMNRNEDTSLNEYKKENGLLSILPYSDGDIEITSKMLPFYKLYSNTEALTLYLKNMLSERTDPLVLYCLAQLDAPILIETNEISKVDNLTFKDQIYLALTYAELGDLYKANEIYENKIKNYVKAYDKIAFVEYGSNEDDYLNYTSLVMLLSSKLNLSEKDLFYNYVSTHYSNEFLTNAELLTFIINEIDTLSNETVKVIYEYEGNEYTKELKNGNAESITIPSSKLKDLTFKNIEGNASIVAIYNKYLTEDIKLDNNLTVSRKFYSYSTGKEINEIKKSDIVKVVIDWDISDKAIDDIYAITDYAPSGLVPIENAWDMGLNTDDYYYRNIDGQKVTFYVSKDNVEKKQLYYYARVISTGKYCAEGTIIQGTTIKDSINIGEKDIIEIK